MKNILEIKNLDYKDIISNLNVSIEKNKIYSISGSNNSGKTTLIRILKREITSNNSIFISDKDISKYQIHELKKLIQGVIPLEVKFIKNTLLEELEISSNKKQIDYLTSNLKVKGLLKKKINTLTKEEIVLGQILIALSTKPKILLLDSVSNYLSKKKLEELFKFLKITKTTVILTTNNLEDALLTDYLYILNEGSIALEGNTMEVLEKDNILNKLGLRLPFMVDLSVKLKDYDLIKDIELNKNRMVDILWK